MGISENFNLSPESPKRANVNSKIFRIVGKEREAMIASLMAKHKGMTREQANNEVTNIEIAKTNGLVA